MKKDLDKFFFPQSVAVVGATDKREKVGFAVMRNLREGGFQGDIFAVNPKYATVQGTRCWRRVQDLPQVPDLLVLATPARTVPAIVRDFGKAGGKAAVVLSAGFGPGDAAGEKLFLDLQKAARQHGVRLLGPNSLGLLTPAVGLNASFAPAMPEAGRLAFISQSGALGSAILDWAVEKRVGFSHFATVGGLADLDFDEMIDYFGTDSRTACILIYLEELAHARRFLSAARAFARSKPVVVLKGGATDDAVYDAAFRRAGIIRVGSIQELFDCAQALATQPLPMGKRLAIVSNAGGPATLAAAALSRQGGTLATFSPQTAALLPEVRPLGGDKNNPVDLLGDATPEHFRAAVRACLADPNADAVLTILTPQGVTDAAATARAVAAESQAVRTKPLYASWMGQRSVREGRGILETQGIPWYPFPERGVATFLHAARYRENLDLLYEIPPDLPFEFPDIRREEARQIVAEARLASRFQLDDPAAQRLLNCYGIPTGQHDKAGRQLFLGAERNPVFGPVIRLGAGGEFSAIWPEQAAALPPLNLALARHLVEDARLVRLLPAGGQGLDPLLVVLCRFAYLLMDLPDVQSFRIDPFCLYEQGTVQAAQASAVLAPVPAVQRLAYEHLVIQPYPTQWVRPARLPDGTAIVLRPIRPEDTPLEAAMLRQVSRQSLYFRFFGYTPGLDERALSRFTHIDYDREMAIVAQVDNAGQPEIVGVVRIVGDGWRDTAEYAILVADAWHGRGLGSLLTDYILEIARAQGYRQIVASFLKTNGAMRRVFERKKFRIRNGEDGADWAELTL